MNEYFRVYNDSPILNRELEFPVTPLLYMIDDIMKIKMTAEWHHTSNASL